MKTQDMTQGSPWKGICLFMIPVFAGLFLQQLYHTVGTIIVGNYVGELPLAAVGSVGCVLMLFLAIANGFSAGAGIIVAQAFGAKDHEQMRLSASTSLILQAILCLICLIVSFAIGVPILHSLMGLDGEILELAKIYFWICAAGFPFLFGYNIVSGILRGVGDSAATLYFLLIASVINIGLNYLFVALMGWGVSGSALAMVIAQTCSFAAAWIYMRRKYPDFRFSFREYRYDHEMAKRILKTGYPMALQQIIVSFGFILIQRAVVSYGQAMIASYTVAQRLECYLFMAASAFQITMATFTGQNVGAKEPKRIRQGTKQMVIMSFTITVIIISAFLFFEKDIIRWFGLSDTAFDYCFDHLKVTAYANLLLAVYFPVFGVYQGTNHAIVPTFTAMSVLFIRVLSVYTLCDIPEMDYRIIWYNQPIGFAMGVIITWTYYRFGSWRKELRCLQAA